MIAGTFYAIRVAGHLDRRWWGWLAGCKWPRYWSGARLRAGSLPPAHVRAARPRGATASPARPGEIDAEHAALMSAFVRATQSGDLTALIQLLASDVRVVTDGGGKVRAAQVVIDGADRVARFLVDARRKRAGAWWRENFTLRFAAINGLPGVIVDGPEGPVQTAAFEIEGGVIRAPYVVRNPDKLRHLAAGPAPHESGRG